MDRNTLACPIIPIRPAINEEDDLSGADSEAGSRSAECGQQDRIPTCAASGTSRIQGRGCLEISSAGYRPLDRRAEGIATGSEGDEMTNAPKLPVAKDTFARPQDLHLDLMNPRVPDESFETEESVLEYLLENADVDELIQSIASSGWLDYEPLIVLDQGDIVLEGNRRLAALRLIEDPGLRERLSVELPAVISPEAIPETIRIRKVNSRQEARDFIGFKHINGPFKWDALAKAKYAAEWFREGGDIAQISRRLGDNHNTVSRLVNGWNVLHQSLAQGFEREHTTKKSFPFSHLYTALARPNVRKYLGLPEDDVSAVLQPNPVPPAKVHELQLFMSWLYGQKNQPTVIGSQNPDLNRLVDVLGNENARTMLETTRDLKLAYSQVEDKTLQFSRSLMLTIKDAEDTLKLVGNFDGRADLMSAGDNLRRTVLSLHGAMKAAKARLDEGDAGDAS